MSIYHDAAAYNAAVAAAAQQKADAEKLRAAINDIIDGHLGWTSFIEALTRAAALVGRESEV